jgi:ferredoxin-type protein NapH
MDPIAWLEHVVASLSLDPEALIAVATVLALYAILGRVFCSWVCPLDMLFSLFEVKLTGRGPRGARLPQRRDILTPLAVIAAFIAASLALGEPVYTNISPIAAATKAASAAVALAYGVPGILLDLVAAWTGLVAAALAVNLIAEKVFKVKRFWCRYICPTGAFYGLTVNRFSPLKVVATRKEYCAHCSLCSMVCPMLVDVEAYVARGYVSDHRCTRCGRCVEACPRRVLSLRFRVKLGGRRREGNKL